MGPFEEEKWPATDKNLRRSPYFGGKIGEEKGMPAEKEKGKLIRRVKRVGKGPESEGFNLLNYAANCRCCCTGRKKIASLKTHKWILTPAVCFTIHQSIFPIVRPT